MIRIIRKLCLLAAFAAATAAADRPAQASPYGAPSYAPPLMRAAEAAQRAPLLMRASYAPPAARKALRAQPAPAAAQIRAPRAAGAPALQSPLPSARVTSDFGWRIHPIRGSGHRHSGVDLSAPEGATAHAAADGVVVAVEEKGGYGLYVRIRHDSMFETAYAHLSGFRRGLKPGDRVARGQIIGYVGQTGTATGPHLHFETIYGGDKIDPLRFAAIAAAVGETRSAQAY